MKVDARLLLVLVAASIARVAVAQVNCAATNNPFAPTCCALGQGPDNQQSCITCAATVGNNKAYACLDCARLKTFAGDVGDCSQCVQRTAGRNREWACSQVCFNKDINAADAGTAGACSECYVNSDDASVGSCGDCLRRAVALANSLHLSLTDSALAAVRFQCMQYVQMNKNAWAGPACLQQPTVAKAATCLSCLMQGTKQPWQCVQMPVARKMQ